MTSYIPLGRVNLASNNPIQFLKQQEGQIIYKTSRQLMLVKDLFSIIIVNYNGFSYTKSCINSILQNQYQKIEIIVVDNASTDGSTEKLKSIYGDKIKIVELDKNYGPSKARNEGVAVSKGEFLAFLDNDTEVDPGWITGAKKIFDQKKNVGILQCKLMLFNDRKCFDYAGEFISPTGFLVHVAKANEPDKGQYDNLGHIFAAKSAGMFMRRKAFDAIGGFDEDYFIMVEETDLGWRNWLAGFTAELAPESKVYHHFSTSWTILGKEKAHFNARFHGTKNYILTHLKNLESKNLIFIFIPHLCIWIGFAFFRLLTGNVREGSWVLRGIWWHFANIKSTLKKRNKVQKHRTINDNELFSRIMIRESFTQKVKHYFGSFSFLKKQKVEPKG